MFFLGCGEISLTSACSAAVRARASREREQMLSFFNAALAFDAGSARLCCSADSCAPRERLDALRGADERRHDEDADRKQHRLQDVRAGVVETEQDRQRPAAGER